ncbi:31412_t:CDS:2, partial [Racocetra persica]
QIVPGGTSGPSRFNELLEALKNEYESLSQEAMTYKIQREEFEHKVQQQSEEVALIRQGLYELQATHKGIKQHGNGAPGLAAPPQMSMDPSQQPTNQPGHPGNYPGPSGPPQSVPQAGGSSAHSPYLNGGGGPPGTLSQPHTPKRPRIEDGVSSAGPQNPLGMTPSSQQSQPLYGNNSIPPPQSGQGQPISQGYIPPVGPSSKPGNKISKPVTLIPQIPQNIGGPDQQSSGVPTNGNTQAVSSNNKRKNNQNMGAQLPGTRAPIKQGSLSGSNQTLGDMDPDTVPAQLKKEGGDWFA